MSDRTGDPEQAGSLSRLVHRLARRSGITATEVTGSGPGGTVTDDDVIKAVALTALVAPDAMKELRVGPRSA